METHSIKWLLEKGTVFKSYYVVWKPFENKKKEKYKGRLNRTM